MILFKTQQPVLSPCIGVCTLDDRGQCMGCGRTAAEIQRWPDMSDAERQAVIDQLEDRFGES